MLVLSLVYSVPSLAGNLADSPIIINGVTHVPTTVADPDIYALILLSQKWLSDYTKLNTEVPLPQVKFASSEFMAKLYEVGTGTDIDPSEIVVAMMHVYTDPETDEQTYTMFLEKRFEKTNVLHQAYLLHEAVHNVQYRNKVPWCPTQLEGQAYFHQGNWLKAQGSMWNYIGNDLLLRADELLSKNCGKEPEPKFHRREDGDGK